MSKEQIEDRYKQMYRGMISKDREILSEVLDDSFVLIHMTGMRQSKEAFIRAVEDGTLNYFSADHNSIEAEIYGDFEEDVSAALKMAGGHISILCEAE